MRNRLSWSSSDTVYLTIGFLIGGAITYGIIGIFSQDGELLQRLNLRLGKIVHWSWRSETVNVIAMLAALGATYFAFLSVKLNKNQFGIQRTEQALAEIDIAIEGIRNIQNQIANIIHNVRIFEEPQPTEERAIRAITYKTLKREIRNRYQNEFRDYSLSFRNKYAIVEDIDALVTPLFLKYFGEDWDNNSQSKANFEGFRSEFKIEVVNYFSRYNTNLIEQRKCLEAKRTNLINQL